MNRSTTRKHVFLMLFRHEFHEGAEALLQNELYFTDEENEHIDSESRAAIEKKLGLITSNLDVIDKKIGEISDGWDINRIGKVELAILRVAVGEILYDEDVPLSVAINEAVELAKRYAGDSSPAYINAVLAKLG